MVSTARFGLSAFLVLGIMLTAIVPAKGGQHTEEEMKECKKVSRGTLKQILKELGICNKAMKEKTKSQEEHSKKMGCVIKCILQMEKMVDDRGLVTNESIALAVGDRAKGKFRPIVFHLFQECDKKHSKSLDPNDELCAGYSQFGNCIQNSIADMCHVEIPF